MVRTILYVKAKLLNESHHRNFNMFAFSSKCFIFSFVTFLQKSNHNNKHKHIVNKFTYTPIHKKAKLNPLRAQWPMEPALISGFCSVKQMRVFDSPWTGH